MPTRKPSSIPWIGVVVLAVLIGGYVGAYYRTVDPTWYGTGDLPTYRFGRFMVLEAKFFAPIHALDRKLRPHVWEDRGP